MRIGIPKGLLYCDYYIFINTFLKGLDAEIITSPDTNKNILNLGVKYCVDEACLPIKIFHGHVVSIKDKCDFMIVPRIMSLYSKESICPKFCGLPEMIVNNIPNMPDITYEPLYLGSPKKMYSWCKNVGHKLTRNEFKIKKAFNEALEKQRLFEQRKSKMSKCSCNILLTGHPYNIYDRYVNMNLFNKLNELGIGIVTEKSISEDKKNAQLKYMSKKPYWTLFRKSYGASVYVAESKLVDGIIYLSSFGCGVDSINIELIRNQIKDFPFLVLKVDEQTGEAGFDTRLEAFIDMLERRKDNEGNISSSRKYLYSSKNTI